MSIEARFGDVRDRPAVSRVVAGCGIVFNVAGVVATLVLWDQMLHVERLQKRLGVRQPIVEVFSNDSRLADLAAWDPAEAVDVA